MHSVEFNSSRWVTLSEIENAGELACIDGRHDGCIVGAPGGNMGEFILLLTAAERRLKRAFSSQEIQDWLITMAGRFGRFYMHTDEHAVLHLREAMKQDNALGEWLASIGEDLESFFSGLLNLAPQWQETARPYLLKPEYIGCVHLRLLLEHPEDYLTRKELVADALSAFFTLLWVQPQRMNYVMLAGDHQEESVVSIETLSEVNAETTIPVSCKHSSKQNFVNHQVARDYFMHQSCRVMEDSLNGAISATELQAEVNRIASKQMSNTLDKLAKNLPQFRLVV